MRKRGPRTPEKVRELQDKLHLSAKRVAAAKARAGILAISRAQTVRRNGSVSSAYGPTVRPCACLRKSGNSPKAVCGKTARTV